MNLKDVLESEFANWKMYLTWVLAMLLIWVWFSLKQCWCIWLVCLYFQLQMKMFISVRYTACHLSESYSYLKLLAEYSFNILQQLLQDLPCLRWKGRENSLHTPFIGSVNVVSSHYVAVLMSSFPSNDHTGESSQVQLWCSLGIKQQ